MTMTTTINNKMNEIENLVLTIKGLSMALEDCSPAMTNRNNAVQTESITLAIADAINRLSVVVSKELNELSNMIDRSDD